MRTALALALLLATSAAAATQAADEAALREAKLVTWREIYAAGDAAALENFLLDGFEMVGGDGAITPKAAEVAWLKTNRADMSGFVYTIAQIRFVTPDVALVRGEGRRPSRSAAGPCTMRYVSSNLFRRADGRWRPALSHISGQRCDPPA